VQILHTINILALKALKALKRVILHLLIHTTTTLIRSTVKLPCLPVLERSVHVLEKIIHVRLHVLVAKVKLVPHAIATLQHTVPLQQTPSHAKEEL
jgi:hypothetical protein